MLQICEWMRDVTEANQSSTSNKYNSRRSLLRRLAVGCVLRVDPRYSYVYINKLQMRLHINYVGR